MQGSTLAMEHEQLAAVYEAVIVNGSVRAYWYARDEFKTEVTQSCTNDQMGSMTNHGCEWFR